MKFSPLVLSALILGSTAAAPAYALDFKSVGAAPAVLYDAPSEKGRRVFVAPRGMPVEVVLTYGEWSKVRDAAGTLSWVMSKSLTAKRNVVVNVAMRHHEADAPSTASITGSKRSGTSSGRCNIPSRDSLMAARVITTFFGIGRTHDRQSGGEQRRGSKHQYARHSCG